MNTKHIDIAVRNMLSQSCIKLIDLALSGKTGVLAKNVKLGHVQVNYNPDVVSEKDIIESVEALGFSVIRDPNQVLVERIKQAAIELIHYAYNANSLIRNSDYISERVQLSYEKLSKVFSHETGITLEKYIILLKIEKAKEMILQEEYSLSEIAYLLGYSSVQYLSNQFKKTTGLTVSEFKHSDNPMRVPLEELV